MGKAPEAFRTISEVAQALDTPAHVLRFWETKFSQVKPVKRAGGRRYYRPFDIALLAGIKNLLHERGMTVKGVQKLLREEGAGHVVAHAPGRFRPDASANQIPANDTGRSAPRPNPRDVQQPSLFPGLPSSKDPAYPRADCRFLSQLARANPETVQANAARLAPLLERLRQFHGDK